MENPDARNDRRYQRRDGRDVFTSFRWARRSVEPTRLAPPRDELAEPLRAERAAKLRKPFPIHGPDYNAPFRIVVYGDATTLGRASEALSALVRSAPPRITAPATTHDISSGKRSRRKGPTTRDDAVVSPLGNTICTTQPDELLSIARRTHIDLLLMNPGHLGIKSPAVDAWLTARAWFTAEDSYPAAVVLLTDENTSGESYLVVEQYGVLINALKEDAPVEDWIDSLRRAPGRRLTILLGEGAGQRARACGLVEGPFLEALNAVFDDIALLIPFTPARDAGATLAALAVDEATIWKADRPLNSPPVLSRRAMQSARKHLARRLSRLGLPSADYLIRLVRVAYAVGIARAWRVSLDEAARYAGFRTGRQLMAACPRVAGGGFRLLVRHPTRNVAMHFALMLFRDYWNDLSEQFEWTFQDTILTEVAAPWLPGGRALRERGAGDLITFHAFPHTETYPDLSEFDG